MGKSCVRFTALDQLPLHDADAAGADVLLVEAVPDDDAWLAVRDRLRRAQA